MVYLTYALEPSMKPVSSSAGAIRGMIPDFSNRTILRLVAIALAKVSAITNRLEKPSVPQARCTYERDMYTIVFTSIKYSKSNDCSRHLKDSAFVPMGLSEESV